MRLALIVAALVAVPVLAQPKAVEPKKTVTLDSPYTPKLGDFLALELSAGFASLKTIDAPIIVSYDLEKKKLLVLVVGSRAQPADAKETIEKLAELVALMSPSALKERGVAIGDDNVIYIYRNKSKRESDLLKRENGKYTP
jgi:hypothetical protein